ncbi:MAG: hypothetical protein IT230_01770 [Flavobacteriales bacterium]|nr:hypothetical protein [Flavobacteriales bacterium]
MCFPKIAVLVATTALPFMLCAQTKTDKAQVKWGPEQTTKEHGTFDYVIDDLGNSAYLAVYRKKDFFIQRMDGVRTMWQRPVELEWDGEDLTVERILLTNKEVLVFASLFSKKDSEHRLYLQTFSQADLSPLKSWDRVAVIAAEKAANKGGFHISASPDRSKILVHVMPPLDKEDVEKSRMNVYDADMNPLWRQDFQLPYTDKQFTVESQRLDNDGSVVVLGVKYADKLESKELKRANKATYEYHLLVYGGTSAAPQDYPITVQDKFLQDMTLSMADKGDIICAGLFGNKDSFNARGAYFLRLDRASKQVVHSSFKDFSDDFITMYMTGKQAEKVKKKADRKEEELELPEFELHDIIHREDGGAVLLAEQYIFRISTYTTSSPNGGTTTTTVYNYYYNDVLVVNIDPQGNIEWATKVPKRQHSANDGGRYSSIAVDVKGDNIYLVFNDSGENLFVKPGDKLEQFSLTGKDALVVLATIDGDGNVSREALFAPDRRDVILRPKDCVELSDKTMFIYASRKNDYRFGQIVFD